MRITVPLLPESAYNSKIRVFHNDLPVANCSCAAGLDSCSVAIPDHVKSEDCTVILHLIDSHGNQLGPMYTVTDGELVPYNPDGPVDWESEMKEEGTVFDMTATSEVDVDDGMSLDLRQDSTGVIDNDEIDD